MIEKFVPKTARSLERISSRNDALLIGANVGEKVQKVGYPP